jgi:hypothetical protein
MNQEIYLQKNNKKQRIYTILISLLIIIGLFTPTSIDSNISKKMLYFNLFFVLAIFLMLLFINFKVKKIFIFSFIFINAILLIFTMFSPFSIYSYGAGTLYLLLSLLFCLNLKDVKVNPFISKVFIVVNLLNVTSGILIINNNMKIKDLFVTYYSNFYPELLPNAMFFNKPVLTFSTHSIAGFYFFIFTFLNLKTFEKTNKLLYLLFSIPYIIFLLALNSNTGYFYFFISIIYFMYILGKTKRSLFILFMILIGIFSIFKQDILVETVGNISTSMEEKFSSRRNGFIGRFSDDGNLRNNLDFIANHPFEGVGIGYSPELMYADSGIIETCLRGTILFTIVIYISFFLFLKSNLMSKKTAFFLYFVFMLFELGFSNLIYFRTLYILPFIIVYLNHLESYPSRGNQVLGRT